jgi:hypothetical protein
VGRSNEDLCDCNSGDGVEFTCAEALGQNRLLMIRLKGRKHVQRMKMCLICQSRIFGGIEPSDKAEA